jgi:hypothetical protein
MTFPRDTRSWACNRLPPRNLSKARGGARGPRSRAAFQIDTNPHGERHAAHGDQDPCHQQHSDSEVHLEESKTPALYGSVSVCLLRPPSEHGDGASQHRNHKGIH